MDNGEFVSFKCGKIHRLVFQMKVIALLLTIPFPL